MTDIITSGVSLPVAIEQAKSIFLSGDINPLEAWANMSRFKKIIESLQGDSAIKEAALTELSKYGKGHNMPDCKLEESEVGVNYDYSVCGDSTLNDSYKLRDAICQDIKEREAMLKAIPEGGNIVDPKTGEILSRPIRESKTTIKVTFNK